MREYEQEQLRVRTKPTVSRSVLDDVSAWWHGEETTAQRAPRPEVPFTKQDFEQSLSLVSMPVNLARQEIEGKPDRFKFGSAATRIGPAVAALQVIANGKREAKNKANLLAPVADLQSAQTTMQVLGDWMAAPKLWAESFQAAMAAIDKAIAAPVIDPDAAKDAENADPPPADGVQKREHDLMVASLKPIVARLIEKTGGEPFTTWNPREYTEGNEAMAALGAISAPQLAAAKAAVERGMQAISVYAADLDKSIADAKAKLESAQQKLSQSAQSSFESDPTDPSSPSYRPPEEAK
jgi:hypothetical protein